MWPMHIWLGYGNSGVSEDKAERTQMKGQERCCHTARGAKSATSRAGPTGSLEDTSRT